MNTKMNLEEKVQQWFVDRNLHEAVGALYARRHGRKDLIAAYLGINVGVLAVTLLMPHLS